MNVKKLLTIILLLVIPRLVFSQTYCESFNFNDLSFHITNLTLGDIDNTSTNTSNFTHYPSASTSLQQGATYSGSINYIIPPSNSHHLHLWIDYNNNGIFDDAGEEIASNSGTQPSTDYSFNFTFTVPNDGSAVNGTTRLRAMVTRINPTGPCSTQYTAGEVEDYDIEIRPNPVAPTAVCQNLNLDLDIFGDVSITASDINNGSFDDYDAAGDLTLSIDQTDFDCDHLGDNTVTLTVTDVDGLSNTCTANVNIHTYRGSFDVPPFDDIEAYCEYTVATPVLDYQCLTTITATTDDLTTFDTPGTYTITWNFFNGGVTETEVQTVIISNPTTPTGLTIDNIDEEDIDLSWSSTDNPPYKVRYKETTESVWNEIKGITTTNTTLSGLKNNIQYDVQVATDADCAPYTSTVNFTTLELGYCIPSAINNDADYYLDIIDMNGLYADYNPSSHGTYEFHDDVSTTIALGENLTGDITFNKAEYENGYFNIWIDFNIDGDYDDAGEFVWSSNNLEKPRISVLENVSIPIPLTASIGKTRMRVSTTVVEIAPSSSCSYSNQKGEVLEFEIELRSNATPPTAVCKDLNIQLDIFGNATITASQLDNGSTDDYDSSGDLKLSVDKTDFNCDNLGDNDVVLTVTDSDGLSSTCTANVNVSTYSGNFVAPPLDVVNAYCEYTAVAPVLNYQCNTIITGTTPDPTVFNTVGSYSIDWSFDDGTTVVTSTQTINVITPTTPTALSTSNITETNVDISWNAVDPGPFVVRYKKTSDATWTEVNSTTTDIELSSLDTGTEYEVQVKVDAPSPVCANYTSSIIFTTTAVNYCETGINLNDSATNYINDVSIGDISQTSTNADDFYTYYSGVSTELVAGGTISSGTITYQRESGSTTQFAIWIDFNKNGIFDDITEKIYENTTAGSAVTEVIETLNDIAIPSSALTGQTRMRVAMVVSNTGIVSACDYSNGDGEVEDYDVIIGTANTNLPTLDGLMITQVYHSGTDERWIEVTNNSAVEIAANSLIIALYQNKTGDQTGIAPDAVYTYTSAIAANTTVLIRKTGAVLTHTGTPLEDTTSTDFDGADDILILTNIGGSSAWDNRVDIISDINNETSYVRNDNVTLANTAFTSSEWTAFVDDNLDPYNDLALGGAERHPNAPLLSEIANSLATENIRLGVHAFGSTARASSAWSNGSPDRSRQVDIDEDYSHAGTSLKARNLNVGTGVQLTVADEALLVNNVVNIDTGAEIRLDGEAQLIQTHTNASAIVGDGKLSIDRASNSTSVYWFNYFSSPVNSIGASNFTVADVMKDGTTSTPLDITFDDSIEDGDTTTPITIAENWIYTYTSNGSDTSNYIQSKSSGTIAQTDGFTMKGPGAAQNYTFVGTPKDGTMTATVGGDESYLLGNPYASAISAKKFIEDNINTIDGTIYLWEHVGQDNDEDGHYFGGYQGGYATLTTTMGLAADGVSSNNTEDNDTPKIGTGSYTTPENYIPVGQGFFISGDADGGTIEFNNSQREYVTESSGNSVFLKTEEISYLNQTKDKEEDNQNTLPILKLGMDYLGENNVIYHSQIGVSFDENTSFDYEPGYDAISYNTGSTKFAWKFENDDREYVIAGVPSITNNLEVPLTLSLDYDGEVVIDIDEWQNVDREVYLLDKQTQETQTLDNGKATLNLASGIYSDRFAITFSEQVSLTNAEAQIANIVTTYSKETNTISLTTTTNVIGLELIDMFGKSIAKANNTNYLNLNSTIPANGVYILKVETSDNNTITKKILID